jgi:hypothetical protein
VRAVCDRCLVVSHDDLIWLAVGNDREDQPRELLGLDAGEAHQLAHALTEAAECVGLRPPRRRKT